MVGLNLGKQLHSVRVEIDATPQGCALPTIPKKAFIYDVYVDNKTNLPPEYYADNRFSIGVPGNKEYVTKKLDISKGGVCRAELGEGAGCQNVEIVLHAFWHFFGKGQPSSGPITVLVLFDLS